MRRLAPLAFLLAAAFLQSQTPPSQVPVPTIRANTRMILVSVVATDKSGPVTDLTSQDFSVLEDGKPQKMAAFAFEHPALTEQKAETPLPSGVYTNRPNYLRPAGPLTILLLDALNTQERDQRYFRQELLHYLQNQVKPGQRLAVFVLGSQLHLLQDFTSDPALLRAAVESFSARTSEELAQEDVAVPTPPKEGRATDSYLRMLRTLKQLAADRGEVTANQKVDGTLSAFRTIARSVAGYPGRKNLVWVSGSFPLTYKPELALSSQPSRQVFYRSYQREIRETANVMGDAQISIYPVDARGLVGFELVDASTRMTDETGHFYTGPQLQEMVTRGSDDRLNAQAAMEEVADSTGGRAFMNRNDIDNAVALSVADGSSYYTLAYYPANKEWHGEFRKISIRIARKGVRLRYRNGYFATEASQQPKIRDAELAQALRSDALPATMVIFDAKVLAAPLPVPASDYLSRKYLIDFMVDTRTLSSEPMTNGGHHFSLEFHAAAFSPDGTLVAHTDTQVSTWAGRASYEGIREDGLPFHTTLQLPAGRYQMRLLVRDIRTGYLGSVDVPLVVEAPGTRDLRENPGTAVPPAERAELIESPYLLHASH
jgi:VWFA-related protein